VAIQAQSGDLRRVCYSFALVNCRFRPGGQKSSIAEVTTDDVGPRHVRSTPVNWFSTDDLDPTQSRLCEVD